jgi:hypothetical protein
MDGVSSATKPETVRMAPGAPPLLVLDNNVLRNEVVIERCIARYRETGAQFALPEMVMFELTKHPEDWEATVRRSLEYVLRCPDALVITHTAKDLGLAEEATGRPTERVVNDKITSAWRKLLLDLREGDGPDLDYFRWAVPNLRAQPRYEEYETDSLAMVQRLKTIAAAVFPRELVARVGNDLSKDDRQSFREFLVRVYSIEELRDAHVRRGVAKENANGLLSAPSVSYLFCSRIRSAWSRVDVSWGHRHREPPARSERHPRHRVRHAIFQIMDEHVRSYDPARTIRAQLGPEPPANWTIHYDPARGTFTISDAPPT